MRLGFLIRDMVKLWKRLPGEFVTTSLWRFLRTSQKCMCQECTPLVNLGWGREADYIVFKVFSSSDFLQNSSFRIALCLSKCPYKESQNLLAQAVLGFGCSPVSGLLQEEFAFPPASHHTAHAVPQLRNIITL